MQLPKGYGYPLKATDGLLLNHMIHNLTPMPTQVYMVYADRLRAEGLARRRAGSGRCGRSGWTCRAATSIRSSTSARAPAGRAASPIRTTPGTPTAAVRSGTSGSSTGRACWSPPPATCIPGGLHTDLKVRAAAAGPRRLFRSVAKYFEPAGAVSWDVAMTGHAAGLAREGPQGRRALASTATYDTRRASWWESMGIMVAYMADGGPGQEPVQDRSVDRPGRSPTGTCRRTTTTAAARPALPDPRTLPDGADNPGFVDIVDFRYQLGDLSLGGPAGNPPVIHAGPVADLPRRRRRREGDLPLDHLVQGALQPHDGHRVSDRGRGRAVRVGHARQRGAAGDRARSSGRRPTNLSPGTYTYFCRIHPFMRGAFRVKP